MTTAAMAPLFRDHFGMDRVIEGAQSAPVIVNSGGLAQSLGEVGCLVHFGKMLKMKDIFFISQVRADWVAGMDDALKAINLKLGAASSGMHFSDKFALLLNRLGVADPDQRYITPLWVRKRRLRAGGQMMSCSVSTLMAAAAPAV